MHKILIISVIFLLSALAGVAHAAEVPNGTINIAIIDFDGTGTDESQCAILTDKMRSAIVSAGGFRVMERSAMEQILKEQGLQQTGACNTNACIVEAGQLLGVSYLLAGRLSRTEGLFAISVRIIDVRTGMVLSGLEEFVGYLEGRGVGCR